MRSSQRPLELFFPFDPYLLKRSSSALRLSTSYIRYKGIQVLVITCAHTPQAASACPVFPFPVFVLWRSRLFPSWDRLHTVLSSSGRNPF